MHRVYFESGPKRTRREANLQLREDPGGFLQNGVHAVRHRHRVLPVVVGHAAVVLPYGHGEPTKLLQLEAARRNKTVKTRSPASVQTPPAHHLPGLPTGAVNHVDKDSRPDLLEGINVKMEPGREEGGGILNQEEQVQVWTPSVTSSRKPAVRIGGKHGGKREGRLTFQSLCKWAWEG